MSDTNSVLTSNIQLPHTTIRFICSIGSCNNNHIYNSPKHSNNFEPEAQNYFTTARIFRTKTRKLITQQPVNSV